MYVCIYIYIYIYRCSLSIVYIAYIVRILYIEREGVYVYNMCVYIDRERKQICISFNL